MKPLKEVDHKEVKQMFSGLLCVNFSFTETYSSWIVENFHRLKPASITLLNNLGTDDLELLMG